MHARGLRAKGLRLELTLSVPPSRASPSRPEQQPIQQPTGRAAAACVPGCACKFYAAATLLQSPDPHAVTAPSVTLGTLGPHPAASEGAWAPALHLRDLRDPADVPSM